MTKPRTPRSIDSATGLLARYADASAELGAVESARNNELARINAAADSTAAPLLEELEQLRVALQPWWVAAGKALLPKGRKSMELGGCMVGSRIGKAKLSIAGDENDLVEVLKSLRWAKPFLRTKISLDKQSTLSSIDGKYKVAFAELGVSREDGEEQFFIEPVRQAGTMGGA